MVSTAVVEGRQKSYLYERVKALSPHQSYLRTSYLEPFERNHDIKWRVSYTAKIEERAEGWRRVELRSRQVIHHLRKGWEVVGATQRQESHVVEVRRKYASNRIPNNSNLDPPGAVVAIDSLQERSVGHVQQ